jgi:hypothetical protein
MERRLNLEKWILPGSHASLNVTVCAEKIRISFRGC